jgi:hypothetical protein
MFDNSSPHFSWKILDELPFDKVVIQFPRNPISYSQGYVVQVVPQKGIEWIGNFKGIDKQYFSGVFVWPKTSHICVIARGSAYVVHADNPEIYEELSIVPIIDAHNVVEQEMIVFSTFWEVSAFGERGLLWTTQNLAVDGIEIRKIENGLIYGVSKSYDKDIPFRIDLITGATVRGNVK